MRLDRSSLFSLPSSVVRPRYDPADIGTGIVHFGPGAFHRAHQAAYVDALLAADPRWGIAAVSLRSGRVTQAMASQDGLYTLAILDAKPSYRVIAAHTHFLGPDKAGGVRRLLASPAVSVVTATVTEKGYCFGPDGTLDFTHPDIIHDLDAPAAPPRSLAGWIARGLADRRTAGLAPFATLSCDNMVANGRKLGAAVESFVRVSDPGLADWIAGEARFPDTMVDSITPATDEALITHVRDATCLDDAIPVSRESYTAWVVEDILPAAAPDLAACGVILSSDVGGYERAKLRILNGAHSTLAYLGLLLGHETVQDAMQDDALAAFVRTTVSEDVLPSLTPSPIDLPRYAADILARFANPAVRHLLAQIAWDGSQKIPYRLLDTVSEARRAGRPVDRLALAVAAWMVFVRRQARDGAAITDPLAAALTAIGRNAASPKALVDSFLQIEAVFTPPLAADALFREALVAAAQSLEGDPRAAISAVAGSGR